MKSYSHEFCVTVRRTVVEQTDRQTDRQTDGECRVMSWLAAVRLRICHLMSENMKTKMYRTVILCDASNERKT
jgi:hypothetical protein